MGRWGEPEVKTKVTREFTFDQVRDLIADNAEGFKRVGQDLVDVDDHGVSSYDLVVKDLADETFWVGSYECHPSEGLIGFNPRIVEFMQVYPIERMTVEWKVVIREAV
jgi:hypothetical protein